MTTPWKRSRPIDISGESRGSLREKGQRNGGATEDVWKDYDPTWLVALARTQKPKDRWLADALARCTRVRVESKAMIHFVDPHGSEWDFDTNIALESELYGDLVLDVLKGRRIGGVEFLSRI